MAETKTKTRSPRQILQTFQRLLNQVQTLHQKQAGILQELAVCQEEWQAALGNSGNAAGTTRRSRERITSEPTSNDH